MDIRKIFIKPHIPEQIKHLTELAFNVWSCWDQEARRLFRRLDPTLFRDINHNPVELLYRVSPQSLKDAAKDKGFLYELHQVYEKFVTYMKYDKNYTSDDEKTYTIAYTSMEYGLHESIPIYSGGLGILSGDHLKSASDIGVDIVSFGLLYKYGYFTQQISTDGEQVERFHENMWHLSPVVEVTKADSSPLVIEIPLKGELVFAKLSKICVGRIPLYLLDTDIHQNSEKFRGITRMLYDSNQKTRLEQEIILGRGSIIALRELGITPKVYHINEGHTAFSILERILHYIKSDGFSLEEASALVRASTIFTTHTPVVEGNEHFPEEMIVEYLRDDIKTLKLTQPDFLKLGKIDKEKQFWLPAYALRYSGISNGVSKIHASVSKDMWKGLFPTLHRHEIPIKANTNGVHLQSWLSLQMTELFDRYIGPDYYHLIHKDEIWDRVYEIPDGEIWSAHRRRKEQVISFIRRRIGEMKGRHGYTQGKISKVEQILNPDYLTIGFARRMAPYKRANMIFRNPERLAKIITDEQQPIQFVFSGKAHPADARGKEIIKEIFDFIKKYSLENHVVFLEDYNINIAQHLVQGVDIWLNTPTKPMEASGTSGMKAGINGILNLSILDGWWPEAYNGENGWAIIGNENFIDPEIAAMSEANYLYQLLENEITDLYYNRAEGDVPAEWVKMMKNSIVSTCRTFNMQRVVREYLNRFYLPQAKRFSMLSRDNFENLRDMISLKKKMDSIWNKVNIRDYFTSADGKPILAGDDISIDCYVFLDDIDRDLIQTEVFYYSCDEEDKYKTIPLTFIEQYEDKVAKYFGKIKIDGYGLQELGTRIVPANSEFRTLYPEYTKWKD